MFARVALLLGTSLHFASTNSAEEFFPFGNINITYLSEQCRSDVTTFSTSLALAMETYAKCLQNGGCTNEQQMIVNENMFALQQLDAFGKLPPGLLALTTTSSGSYRECKEVIAPYTNNATAAIGAFPKIGMCISESCTEEDVITFLNTVNVQGVLPLKFFATHCVPTSEEYSTAFWIIMSAMAFFVLWAILATIVDFVLTACKRMESFDSTGMRAFLAFSFYSNSSLLMSVSPHKEGTLKSLPCIRFISMTWVAAGHGIGHSTVSDSYLPVLKIWNPLLSLTIINAFFAVDTFLLLSGVLVSYMFFKVMPSSKFVRNPLTWLLHYIHRYLRLTPPLMMFIAFYTVTLPFTNGPWSRSIIGFFNSTEELQYACKKNWWHNMLYINNLFNHSEECYDITWYLAVDTQLYAVAPVFLVTLFVSPIAGILSLVICIAASIGYVYVITFKQNLPAVSTGAFAMKKYLEFFEDYYEKPWTRCPPYLVGMLAGYFLARLKGRKPHLSRFIIIPMWLLAFAVGFASVYSPHRYIKGQDDWKEFVRGTYNNFSRLGWALAVSWVIVADHLGWGGIISKFMDHPFWQPLGRLSYCGYIVHFYLLRYIFNLDDQASHFVSLWQSYICKAIPLIVSSYVFAFFWSCIFEVPAMKLEKILIATLIPKESRGAVQPKSAAATNKASNELGPVAMVDKGD